MSNFNDDIYIDLLLSNSIQTNSNNRVLAQFSQTSTQPILKSTNDYKLSIIRFYLNTETLPVFIPVMKNASTTIYSITMEYNNVTHQQYMEFQPQNVNPIHSDEYYYVYNYQYLMYLINQCFQSCVDAVKPGAVAPKITFNADRCTITLDDSVYGYNEQNKINIYFNYPLYSLLASIPAMQLNQNVAGKDYQLNNLMSDDPSILRQEYSTLPILNPVASIVFTSNLLPIYQSNTPPIQIYIDGKLQNSSSSYNFMNILTDFVANEMSFTPFVQYSPTIYRYLTMKPNTHIQNIDLQIFWMKKTTGELKPLYIGAGGCCSVKLYLTKTA